LPVGCEIEAFYIERFLRFIVVFMSSKQGNLQDKFTCFQKIAVSGVQIKHRRLCCGTPLAAM
jgi:hypothetical protein